MFLADVKSRLDVEIDDNLGSFYEMPNGLNASRTSNWNDFCKLSLKRGHEIPNKVLVLKNAKCLSFTFKSYDTGNNEGMVHHRL